MNYGIPYKGSKNKIAQKIIEQLPPAEHFYDLFAGGCAITHAALLSGKYKFVHANDIVDIPQLFLDATQGKYKDEKRWISREDFARLKDSDPYVRTCWSFGNNCKSYLYSKEIEDYKKAYWYLIVYDDFSLYQKYSTKLSDEIYKKTRKIKDTKQKRIICRHEIENYFIENHNAFLSGHNQRTECKHIITTYSEIVKFLQLERLERLQSLERLERLEVLRGSYKDVKIENNSVIYCDIPYKNTDDYLCDFDHEEFYSWAEKQQNIYISEYSMPIDRFSCIYSTKKRQNLNGGGCWQSCR